jgi:hypothetical protein
MDAIIGGLIVIVTIVVTKLLESFQKSKDYRYDLKRTYFEKKLSAAEAAISSWYSAASTLKALAALYEQVSTDKERKGWKVYESMNQAYSSQLTRLEQSSTVLTNSIAVYFDLDDDFQGKEALKSFFKILAELQDLSLSEGVLRDLKKQFTGTSDEPYVDILMNNTREQIAKGFRGLSAVLDQAHKEMIVMSKAIRNEIKKDLD